LERHDLVSQIVSVPVRTFPSKEQEGEVVDLMAALRESVDWTKEQCKAPSKREAS